MKAREPIMHKSFYQHRGHTWTVQISESESGYRAAWRCPEVDSGDTFSHGGFATIWSAGNVARMMIRTLPKDAYEVRHD